MKPEKYSITNEMAYQRFSRLEEVLLKAQSLLLKMYPDESEALGDVENAIGQALSKNYDLRLDYQRKLLAECQKKAI